MRNYAFYSMQSRLKKLEKLNKAKAIGVFILEKLDTNEYLLGKENLLFKTLSLFDKYRKKKEDTSPVIINDCVIFGDSTEEIDHATYYKPKRGD